MPTSQRASQFYFRASFLFLPLIGFQIKSFSVLIGVSGYSLAFQLSGLMRVIYRPDLCALQNPLDFSTVQYNNTRAIKGVNIFVPNNMKKVVPRTRGRPRTFDRDEVLDLATITFWSRGYSGTSLDNLTDSMAINRPSLYAAFGSKHELFLEVIDRYAATLGCVPSSALKSGISIRQAVADFFELSIRCATSKGKPRGCLIGSVATFEAEMDGQVKDKVSAIFGEAERAMAAYFQAAREDGQLPGEHDPLVLARMVTSVGHSIAIRARVGASRKQLLVVVNDFMAMLFPSRGQD